MRPIRKLKRVHREHGRVEPCTVQRHGIVHVIGPEVGLTLPGLIIVCGDSHTATHGAFGALAFGIGTSDIEHVLAKQTFVMRKAKTLAINFEGSLPLGIGAKDMALAVVNRLGAAGGVGSVIEYRGAAVRELSMEGRMTLCNMAIEAGARAGLIAPDEKTIDYLRRRERAPKGEMFERAAEDWLQLRSDEGAHFDDEIKINIEDVAPLVTWGTSPEDVIGVDAVIPDPATLKDPHLESEKRKALDYMGLKAGDPIAGTSIDYAFIGSCANGRIEDLRAANMPFGRS